MTFLGKIFSLTTDGARNMTGKFNGVQGFINQHLEGNEKGHKIHFFHCVINQEVLFKNSMKLNHVDDVIYEFLKNIKNNPLKHRRLREHLEASEESHQEIIYHHHIQWLRKEKPYKKYL